MSPAVLERPGSAAVAGGAAAGGGSPSARERGPTIAGVVATAWEGLAARRGVACPLCGGQMEPRYGASGVEPVGGRCRDCATTLG